MSRTGIPSVMQTTRPTPASAASRIASAAKRGGTKIIEVFAPASATARATVSKTGIPSTSCPPLPGVTPATTLRPVPAVAERVERPLVPGDALDDEARPLVDEDAHAVAPARSAASSAASSMFATRHDPRVRRLREDPPPVLRVRPVQAHDDRDPSLDSFQRLEDALRHQVAPGDPSEDVHEHDLHGGVGQHDLERGRHLIGRRAAADVEEVRGPRPRLRHDVERRHHEAGAVADDAHVSVELHVLQALLLRAGLDVVDRELIGQLGDVRVAPQRVVVDRHLRVERDDPVVLEEDQRVHLDEGRVPLDRELVHLPEHVPRPFPRLDRQRADELAHVVRPEPEQRVDVDRGGAPRAGVRASSSMSIPPSAVIIARSSPAERSSRSDV